MRARVKNKFRLKTRSADTSAYQSKLAIDFISRSKFAFSAPSPRHASKEAPPIHVVLIGDTILNNGKFIAKGDMDVEQQVQKAQIPVFNRLLCML